MSINLDRFRDDVMMWGLNHVGHHCVIGDCWFIASQAGLPAGVPLVVRCLLSRKGAMASRLEPLIEQERGAMQVWRA